MFTWVAFPKKWPAFFTRATGRPHIRQHVNGQCAYVADLYRKFLGHGKNQYGFYLGPANHPHWSVRKGPIRHGWMLDETGTAIIDPTRWCFYKGNIPRLAFAPADCPDYDFGMQRFKTAIFAGRHDDMPAFNKGKAIDCNQPDLSAVCGGQVCVERLFWIANLPVGHETFTSEAQRVRIFTWLQDNDYQAFIPTDNWI